MITFFTLVLDGEPWIERHYPQFCKLTIPWRWIVVEGVAANNNCTSWCASIPPRLSTDGTTEYLHALYQKDHRVSYCGREIWNGGKVQMCNFALQQIQEPCILMEIDSDELWTAPQIEALYQLFKDNPKFDSAFFDCNYFMGPDVVTVGVDCYGCNRAYEWKRAWHFSPGLGQRFHKHEPPILSRSDYAVIPHQTTREHGLVFNHMAYATEAQVRFKQTYYAGADNPCGHLYANAVEGWRRLQANTQWPVKLKDFLPWVDDRVQAKRLP